MEDKTVTITGDAYYRLSGAALAQGKTVDQVIEEYAAQFPPLNGPFAGEDFERVMGMDAEAPAPDPAQAGSETQS